MAEEVANPMARIRCAAAAAALGIMGCSDALIPVLPDHTLTPGAIASTDVGEVCAVGYARAHRVWHDRRGTLAKYGLPSWMAHKVEDDDLVPVSLGGDNSDPRNHWPQACWQWSGIECVAGPAVDKDREEWRYHRLVCSGAMPLAGAQRHFLNWGQE